MITKCACMSNYYRYSIANLWNFLQKNTIFNLNRIFQNYPLMKWPNANFHFLPLRFEFFGDKFKSKAKIPKLIRITILANYEKTV